MIYKKNTDLQKYASLYQTSGLDAAVREMKKDGKDTNWIMLYGENLFPGVKRSELNASIRKLDNHNFRIHKNQENGQERKERK